MSTHNWQHVARDEFFRVIGPQPFGGIRLEGRWPYIGFYECPNRREIGMTIGFDQMGKGISQTAYFLPTGAEASPMRSMLLFLRQHTDVRIYRIHDHGLILTRPATQLNGGLVCPCTDISEPINSMEQLRAYLGYA